ncbi:MAG TPA: choice-of-anchor D domain-containing protein [Fimbriimonadaceae bacterium]|nr:choice-of-anchor D domain-containing protein [Fimbriimonadaceae bacterium]
MLSLCLASSVFAQLRIVTHNISNYSGGRGPAIQTAYYGVFNGLSLKADAIMTQEFMSQAATTEFLGHLNTAPGSPGDWAAAPFINGPDTDSAFFYRTSKVQYLGTTIAASGSTSTTNQPRNTYRYDIRPVGYNSASTTLACYSSHMKASDTETDRARRLIEATRIRDNAESLPAGWNFLLGGDFNIPDSSQTAYQELVGSQSNNAGRFFDPILTPGNWNNSFAFRFVHTQDPATQVDDRYDQILLGGTLVDGTGFDYIGNPALPYSTTTWNDPNHSYRSWGNDGGSYNTILRTTANTMVGPTIGQALIDLSSGSGHLPVFLDLRVPPRSSVVPTQIDFGWVKVGQSATRSFTVGNVGDTVKWTTNGIANLSYSLTGSPRFNVATGPFTDAPGGGSNTHTITLDTSIGSKTLLTGTITVSSNDPEMPIQVIKVRAYVYTP